MIFLLAMEPMHLLFKKAHYVKLLEKLRLNCDTCKVSLYADDDVIFIQSNEHELKVTNHILKIFADASGLVTNISKTHYYPIRCDGVDLEFMSQANRAISSFSCTYLGLPHNIRKPTRVEIQPLIQKITNRLPGWQRNFFSYPGRELLVKNVLNSMPTHFLTIFKLPQWAILSIDRFRKSFWRGKGHAQFIVGHCLVN
jgi:hypothetical protein